jgi:hypothetical protein
MTQTCKNVQKRQRKGQGRRESAGAGGAKFVEKSKRERVRVAKVKAGVQKKKIKLKPNSKPRTRARLSAAVETSRPGRPQASPKRPAAAGEPGPAGTVNHLPRAKRAGLEPGEEVMSTVGA